MTENQPGKPNYREFMRARRPELYSDTLKVEISEMDRRQFEFHLHSLTSRKEEVAFENFARALAEKELCPNLIPQTGPTGGGDSKVDTETPRQSLRSGTRGIHRDRPPRDGPLQ